MTSFWRDWTGLPWELGADPRQRQAACCFRTAQAVRETLGLPWPASRMDDWYRAARRGDWMDLRAQWGKLTEPILRPEAGALIRFDNLDGTFGTGVLPDDKTFITVRHHGRLVIGPVNACGNLKLFRLLA